jgi:hypothetical protein
MRSRDVLAGTICIEDPQTDSIYTRNRTDCSDVVFGSKF